MMRIKLPRLDFGSSFKKIFDILPAPSTNHVATRRENRMRNVVKVNGVDCDPPRTANAQ